jgi:hypothetical protein
MKIIEEPRLEVKRKLPWIIDIFLYPLSASGVIHLAVFWLTPPLLGLVYRFILSRILIGVIIAAFLYIMLIGYAFYYLSYCIFDSSKGGSRAPDISQQRIPDKSELISQLFLILACIAVCFWPVAVYHLFTKRADLVFWLLSACGIFFFPMALLAGVLFDATHALNPVFIICSIFRTFFKYCGLVLFFCVLAGLVAKIVSDISNLPKPQDMLGAVTQIFLILNYFFSAAFIYKAVALIYFAMVAAHLLGGFYWWHKDKLNWGL